MLDAGASAWWWLLLLQLASGAALSCLDESGAAVDWWFLIKHPRWADKSHKDCIGNCDGDTYVYITSASPSSWSIGGAPVTSATGSLLGQTLAGIYSGAVPNYVFYNDQLPDGSWSEKYGHSKGFFGFDGSDGAFWVQHSIPKFPDYVKSGYEFGSGQLWYGQHAFCMSLSAKSLDAIAEVMTYAYVQVYDHALKDTSLSNVNAVVAGTQASGTKSVQVEAPWGTLRLFGKASAADEDMLDAIASPALATSLLGQSWLNSGGPIGGYCPVSGVDVKDILTLTLPADDSHVTYVDHSKWAVAQPAGSGWWCALDNNHVASQETRSGLAVCLEQPHTAALLRAAAAKVGPCGPDPGPAPPGPGPAGACCYQDDDKCTNGQTCCSDSGKSYASETTCKQYGAAHGCEWEAADDRCVVGSGPPPPPTPGGACCYYNDESCEHGETCCSSSGKSYESEATCKRYGEKHGCAWESGSCVVEG